MTSQAENAKMRHLAALESAKRAKETLISIRKAQERKLNSSSARAAITNDLWLAVWQTWQGSWKSTKTTLLGAFMALARILDDPAESTTTAAWKQAGASELAQYVATRLKSE